MLFRSKRFQCVIIVYVLLLCFKNVQVTRVDILLLDEVNNFIISKLCMLPKLCYFRRDDFQCKIDSQKMKKLTVEFHPEYSYNFMKLFCQNYFQSVFHSFMEGKSVRSPTFASNGFVKNVKRFISSRQKRDAMWKKEGHIFPTTLNRDEIKAIAQFEHKKTVEAYPSSPSEFSPQFNSENKTVQNSKPDLEPIVEPTSEPRLQSETEPNTISVFEPVSEPENETISSPILTSKNSTEDSNLQSEHNITPNSESDSEPSADSSPEPDSEPSADSSPEPDSEFSEEVTFALEVQSGTESTAEPVIEPENEPESENEPEPENEPESKNEPEPENEPEPVSEQPEPWAEIWPEPGPNWVEAFSEWGPAWTFHITIFPICFLLLAFCCILLLVSSVVEKGWRKCNKSVIALSFLVFSFSTSRAAFLLTDPYSCNRSAPLLLQRLMFSIGFPGLSASFTTLLFVILDTTKAYTGPPRFLRPSFILIMYLIHLSVVVLTDVIVLEIKGWTEIFLFICHLLFIFYGLMCGVGFLYASYILRRNLKASKDHHDANQPRLKSIWRLSYLSGLVAVAVGVVNIYISVGDMGTFSNVTFVEPWQWWIIQTVTRFLEVLSCIMVLTAFMNTSKANALRGCWRRGYSRVDGAVREHCCLSCCVNPAVGTLSRTDSGQSDMWATRVNSSHNMDSGYGQAVLLHDVYSTTGSP